MKKHLKQISHITKSMPAKLSNLQPVVGGYPLDIELSVFKNNKRYTGQGTIYLGAENGYQVAWIPLSSTGVYHSNGGMKMAKSMTRTLIQKWERLAS